MRDSLYPRIFVGSTESDIESISNAIKTRLARDNISPQFHFFNFFDPSLLESQEFLLEAKEADFLFLILKSGDVIAPSNGQKYLGEQQRNVFYFLTGFFLALLGKERISIANATKAEIPLLSSQKDLDLTPFANGENDWTKALRIVNNKFVKKITALGSREITQLPKNPSEVKDLLAHYKVKILNSEGDAFILRKIHMEALEDQVGSRQHHIFSDTSPMEFAEINLKVWDKNKRELSLETVYDSPVKKEFRVIFRNQLSKSDQLVYNYAFNWDKMFSSKQSNFTIKSTADKIYFDLILPSRWDLLYARVIEKRLDGIPSQKGGSFKFLKESKEGAFTTYSYELKKLGANILESQVVWEWKDKAR